MKFTTNFAFHSQETRLYENAPYVDVLQSSDGTLTLSGVLFQETFLCDVHWKHFFRLQFRHKSARDFHFELFSVHSPLLRESYLVSFPPLNYMLKFSGLPCLSSGHLDKRLTFQKLIPRNCNPH